MNLATIATAATLIAATSLPVLASKSFDLGGAAKGTPSTVSYKFAGQDAVAVFVRGPGDVMFAQVATDDGGTWSGWAPIGTLAMKGDPSCTARGTSRIDCAAVGPSNNLYWTTYDAKANTWSGWANIGGYATSNPSVVATTEGGKSQLRVFVRGPASHFFLNTLSAGKWSDWKDLDGTVGDLFGCSRVANLGAHCFDATGGSAIQLTDMTHKTGGDVVTEDLGGIVAGRPSATWSDSALYVFVNGPGKRLWVKTWDSGWSDWEQTDALLFSAPGCDIDMSGTAAWCATVNSDKTVTMWRVEL